MRKFIGTFDQDGNPEAFVPGVPCRDLEEEEWTEHVAAGRIVEGEPSAALWSAPAAALAKASPAPTPPAAASGAPKEGEV